MDSAHDDFRILVNQFSDLINILIKIYFIQMYLSSWRKFRIGINSKPIRIIPKSVSEPNSNQSEPIQQKFSMLFVENRMKTNSTLFESIQTRIYLDRSLGVNRLVGNEFLSEIFPRAFIVNSIFSFVLFTL